MFTKPYFNFYHFTPVYWPEPTGLPSKSTGDPWECYPRSQNLPDAQDAADRPADLFDCYSVRALNPDDPCIYCGPWDDHSIYDGYDEKPDTEKSHCRIGFFAIQNRRRLACTHLYHPYVGVIAGAGLIILHNSENLPAGELAWDAWGDGSAFEANSGKAGNSQLYLGNIALKIFPCLPTNATTNLFCGPGTTLDGYESKWLCNWHVHHGNYDAGLDYKFFCNWAIPSDTPEHADQMAGRPFTLKPNSNRAMMFVTLRTERRGQCFSLSNTYCFTYNTNCVPVGGYDPDLWECAWQSAAAIHELVFKPAIELSYEQRKFPHANHDTMSKTDRDAQGGYWLEGEGDIWLKNTVLANYNWTMGRNETTGPGNLGLDRMYHVQKDDDQNQQDLQQYDSPLLNFWINDEVSTKRSANLSDPSDHRIRYLMDGPDRPGWFGDVVQIRVVSIRTRCVFPAELFLDSQRTALFIDVQKEPFTKWINAEAGGYRTLATCNVTIGCVVQLLPEAYDVVCPYKFLYRPDGPLGSGAADNRDFTFEDPNNPGEPTTDESVICIGPHGEHVPITILWRGIRAPFPFGRDGDYTDGGGVGSPCTRAIQAAKGFYVTGEVDSFPWRPAGQTGYSYPTLEDRYQGAITF